MRRFLAIGALVATLICGVTLGAPRIAHTSAHAAWYVAHVVDGGGPTAGPCPGSTGVWC